MSLVRSLIRSLVSVPRKWPVVAVVVMVMASFLSASAAIQRHPAPVQAARGAPVTQAKDAATAAALARAQKIRVEVLDQRAETRTVYAEPGGMMSAELSPQPVRVRQGDGWAAVDTALVRRADGSVGPRAAAVELSFSGGGQAGPLVRYAKGDSWLELTWPGALPSPSLDGNAATYPEVLPGVDLLLRAEVNGYSQYLMIKSPEAGRSVETVRLGLKSGGVTVRSTGEGALEAVDAKGGVVFAAPVSQMWDAAPQPRRAVVGVSVDAESLTLRPDRALLSDPATVYPVTVDPVWQTPGPAGWASVLEGSPDTPRWNSSGETPLAQVGYCGWSKCNGLGEAWSYFQFDTNFLNYPERRVVYASLKLWVTHTPSCDNVGRAHNVFKSHAAIGTNITWRNRPGGDHIGGFHPPKVNAKWGCPGNKEVATEVTNSVNRVGTTTYILIAGVYNDEMYWGKYDAWATRLHVLYNTPPDFPSELTTDPPLPEPCRFCEGKRYVSSADIRLKARLTDPDGDSLQPVWRVYYDSVLQLPEVWGTAKGSGQVHDYPIDLRGRHNQTIWWEMYANDTADNRGYSFAPHSFIVDRERPSPPAVSARLYRKDNRWHGGVGVADTFQFTARNDDVDHFRWGWSDPPTNVSYPDRKGGTAAELITPDRDGPRTLFVQAVDRAGNASESESYHFYVRAGSGPLAQWSLEGSTVDEAFLGDRDGTLSGAAIYGAGAIGLGLKLDGNSPGTNMAAPNTLRTDTSFSVSAWVRPEQMPNPVMTAVSQDGTRVSGFYLDFRGDLNRWTFMLVSEDEDGPDGHWVVAPQTPELGKWTHLTGVYDRPANQLHIYVNGVPAATANLPGDFVPWHAAGSVYVGRSQWNGVKGNQWAGLLDEVKIYDRVLTPEQVAAMVGRDNVQTGQWRFDELSGTSGRNAIEGGEMAILQNGASFTGDSDGDRLADGGAVGGALRLDGVNDHATLSGPAVRTDASFAVATWVRLNPPSGPGTAGTAVSQDGISGSGFTLGHRDGRWTFGIPGAAGWNVLAQSGPGSVVAGEWVHLTGVYNAAEARGYLYVNGLEVGRGNAAGPVPNAAGTLIIGRGLGSGQPADHWAGLIDEVRVYSRALAPGEVQGIVSRDQVAVGAWKLDGSADGATPAQRGTLQGSPDWTAGQTAVPDPSDLAIRLSGTAHASMPHTVDPRGSFAIAAWARLDADGTVRTVLSQDGSRVSAFKVSATADGRWMFAMSGSDTDGSGKAEVFGGSAQVGVWSHLVAMHDAGKHEISLYVNGVHAGTAAHIHNWDHAAGGLQIGRGKGGGGPIEHFPGAIDDVTAYSRVLFAEEIRVLAGRDLTLVHNWTLDEGSGLTVADTVGRRAATLSGGATRVPGRLGNAVALDGVDGSVGTAKVDIRTDANFTVAAWVQLGNVCDLEEVSSCRLVAVSVDGAGTSKFRLGYMASRAQHPDGVWFFELPESDTPGATAPKAAVATLPEDLTAWVHLVGVYDKATNTVRLYVNGTRKGEGTLNTPWDATGGLQIGRGKGPDGLAGQYFPGRVDEVRLYSGMLDDGRIGNLYQQYLSQEGPVALPRPDAGHWKADEGSGTTLADSSGRGLTATATGTVAWTTGGRVGTAVRFDGTAGSAATAGPVLDTARSFSVSTWVHLTQQPAAIGAILGQDGTRVSAFNLHFRPGNGGRWAVLVPGADRDDPPSNVVLQSTESTNQVPWTHLAVVYDAQLRQLRLYVNGRLSAAQVGVIVPPSAGPFTLGRAKWNGRDAYPFSGYIDDVRAFSRAISDGEVRRIHDDTAPVGHGSWRFDDDTVRDASWRNNPTTATGPVSYVPGMVGKALALNGSSTALTAQHAGIPPTGSFTVSAWAKLTYEPAVQTVLGQDATVMSGFVLQYRPTIDRWVFGAWSQDTNAAELSFARSQLAAQLDRWTHLTGVYDHAAGQLRLYVDGRLAGSRDGVRTFAANGGFTIGRGLYRGQPAEFFTGAIDDVRTDLGIVPDGEIALRAGYPVPPDGQVGRFVNAVTGEHYTASTSEPVRAGYRFERSLGAPASSGDRILHACKADADHFASIDANCEGAQRLGQVGRVYSTPPAGQPTVTIYRCRSATEVFESLASDCESLGTREAVLGHAPGYARLARYRSPTADDHLSTTYDTPPGYRLEGPHGWLAKLAVPGTTPLKGCRDGSDHFLSVSANCDGKTVIGTFGHIWTAAPPGVASAPLLRCVHNGQKFISANPTCEGWPVDTQLGFVLTNAGGN